MFKKILIISTICFLLLLLSGLSPVSTQEVPYGMVLIPGGTFEMGSDSRFDNEKPLHTVEVSSFYMDIYELTNQDYCVFLNLMGNQEEGGSKWIMTEKDVKNLGEEFIKYVGIMGDSSPGTFKLNPLPAEAGRFKIESRLKSTKSLI